MCNCNGLVHKVSDVTNNTTYVNLTVSNDTNLSSLEKFYFVCNKDISEFITGGPIPVTVNINGADIALKNKYGIQIKSNKIPRRNVGAYVVPTDSTSPYVILFNTPYCSCNA